MAETVLAPNVEMRAQTRELSISPTLTSAVWLCVSVFVGFQATLSVKADLSRRPPRRS